jgi:quercetin dioxygenase-like cupin family protein
MTVTASVWRRTALGLAALAMTFGSASAVELNAAAIAIKFPDQIKWRDPTGTAPVNQAILHGDPTKTGLYIVMNRFKPGAFSRPHFHPKDRFITVISGTWWVGTGNKWDKEATVPVKAGGVVTHFAKEVHYDGAKDEEVVLVIVGEGPGTLTRVDEAK